MSAELKPCPFCGEVPGVAPSGYVFCMSPHDCPAVQIGTSVEQWNTRAPSPDLDRLRGENERLREQIDPESVRHWDTMRKQRDDAWAEVDRLLKREPDPDWMVWSCKIAAPRVVVGELEHGSDAPMRLAVRAAFARVTGIETSSVFSGWNGHLTDGERAVIEPNLHASLSPTEPRP